MKSTGKSSVGLSRQISSSKYSASELAGLAGAGFWACTVPGHGCSDGLRTCCELGLRETPVGWLD